MNKKTISKQYIERNAKNDSRKNIAHIRAARAKQVNTRPVIQKRFIKNRKWRN